MNQYVFFFWPAKKKRAKRLALVFIRKHLAMYKTFNHYAFSITKHKGGPV